MSTLTSEQVNAEKDEKPRCDLVSPFLTLSVGRGMGRGARKHGTPGGLGTYRIPGTEQATIASHIASLERHLCDLKAGLLYVPDTPGYLTMDAISSQVNILADLFFDPPQEPTEEELRWPWPHLGVNGKRTGPFGPFPGKSFVAVVTVSSEGPPVSCPDLADRHLELDAAYLDFARTL